MRSSQEVTALARSRAQDVLREMPQFQQLSGGLAMPDTLVTGYSTNHTQCNRPVRFAGSAVPTL